MNGSGYGLMAGGVCLEAVPLPVGATVYSPVARRDTSPFRAPSRLPEQEVRKPRVRSGDRRESTVPRYAMPHIVAAQAFLRTDKTCPACGSVFQARVGERIDGFRRRQTCDRVCSYKLRTLTKEEKTL